MGRLIFYSGGSPCQDFSSMKIKAQGLDGSKSRLFYEYLRILNEVKPKSFLLENVKMNSKSKEELDNYLGYKGVLINSNLLSYQSRPRLYWTNLNITQPEDKNISFQTFKQNSNLDDYVVNRTPSRERMWANGNGSNTPPQCVNVTNKDKIQCLTTDQDRSPNSGLIAYKDFCRYLSRHELEQAQTVPLGYTDCLSYRQMQKVLGNGWTVDVICHILKPLTE